MGQYGGPERRAINTTRAYALEKLEESGEHDRLARRHAKHYRDLFERAEVEWERRPTVEWLNNYGWCIDNLRAALDWAFSPEGNESIGVALLRPGPGAARQEPAHFIWCAPSKPSSCAPEKGSS